MPVKGDDAIPCMTGTGGSKCPGKGAFGFGYGDGSFWARGYEYRTETQGAVIFFEY